MRLTRDDFSSISFSRFRGVMGVSLTINRGTKRSSFTSFVREIYIYIYIENRKVYVENGIKCVGILRHDRE